MPNGTVDAELLKSVHRAFCSHKDAKSESHNCKGVVTLSEQDLVLRCKLCGDVKAKLKEQ